MLKAEGLGLTLTAVVGWLLASTFTLGSAALPVQVLRSTGAMPAHAAGSFEIAACHLAPDGDYLVFDRRSHGVHRVTRAGDTSAIVQIGIEEGRILSPLAFDSAADGTFVIADSPTGVDRVQVFFHMGGTVGGFTLPGPSVPRVALGNLVLSGIGSLDYTGTTVLVSQPSSGALISEYSLDGRMLRTFGELRATGHEDDRDLHLALNAGIPLALPKKDGFYFVFLGGVPVFRKYDAGGKLVFERHIQGVEIDRHIQSLPNSWPRRRTPVGEFPIVPPTVRTAGIDPEGRLWVSLATPHTYVYDSDGDKSRAVQFSAAGIVTPSDLFFASDGRLLVAPGCYTFNWR
jgi:hypothetical protein